MNESGTASINSLLADTESLELFVLSAPRFVHKMRLLMGFSPPRHARSGPTPRTPAPVVCALALLSERAALHWMMPAKGLLPAQHASPVMTLVSRLLLPPEKRLDSSAVSSAPVGSAVEEEAAAVAVAAP